MAFSAFCGVTAPKKLRELDFSTILKQKFQKNFLNIVYFYFIFWPYNKMHGPFHSKKEPVGLLAT